MPDPLSPDERALLEKRPRPRHLPLVPVAKPGKRKLPLADEVRPIDERVRPIYAVWEITLACDLACRHCGSRAGKERPGELTTEECLDLAGQMAGMKVKKGRLIGGAADIRGRTCPSMDALQRH